MIEPIKAAFAAGEIKTFMIQGEYLEILEAAYPIDVVMMDRSGAQLSVMRNAEASYFSRPGRYEVIQVTSAAAQTVRMFVGSGDAGTRKTSGDVSVIDGEKSKTLANLAFIGATLQSGVAASYPFVQLWNPLNSGKNLVINKIVIGSATSCVCVAGFDNVMLPTVPSNSAPNSRKSGGANSSTSLLRTESRAGTPVGFTELFVNYVIGSQSIPVEFTEPLIIVPGFGLILYGALAGVDIRVNFHFKEDVI